MMTNRTEAKRLQDNAAYWFGETQAMIAANTDASRDAAVVLQEVTRRTYELARLQAGTEP